MEDGRLDRLLKELPRIPASPGFTGRVLSRLDQPAGERRRGTWGLLWPRLALPAAALAVAFGAVAVTHQVRAERVRSEAAEVRQLLDEIRQEHGRLEDDLRELDHLAAEPVLYLGGDDDFDLVVDLARVPEPSGAPVHADNPAPRL
ncbi:MAG TPA: hypothetical protein VEG34_15815 [Thermoanaerobaculia bacterium]|nr:hypothetical protein [Thermoanaerobaculia bacterium]